MCIVKDNKLVVLCRNAAIPQRLFCSYLLGCNRVRRYRYLTTMISQYANFDPAHFHPIIFRIHRENE